MQNSLPQGRAPLSTKLRRVGSKNVLLTEPEYQCYRQVRETQRRQLLQDLLLPNKLPLVKRLSWSTSGGRFGLQVVIFVLILPFLFIWGFLNYLYKLVRFPFLWASTFRTPGNLTAPGEKNLVGMHYVMGRYLSVSVENYITCVDRWIFYLYGAEQSAQHSFRQTLQPLLAGVMNLTPETKIDDAIVRRYLAQARELLSKKLGHYSAQKQADPRAPQKDAEGIRDAGKRRQKR